jgi:hypothetical protein
MMTDFAICAAVVSAACFMLAVYLERIDPRP